MSSASNVPARPRFRGRFFARLRSSLPPLATAIVGSGCWAAIMAASATVVLWSHGWETPGKFEDIAILYALGAAIAFPIGLMLARFASLGRSAEIAFAAAFLGLSVSTVAVTAVLFAFDYRQYYATWHDDFPSMIWVIQFVFTAGGALVQFAALGLRLFFPIGFVALFAASLWFARNAR